MAWIPRRIRTRRAPSFGIVFQDPSLDGDLTAYENMEVHALLYKVPRKVRLERTERLLRLFELWDRRDSLVKQFSGGMKRRLEIARGFLHTPQIIFLDEPTLGLDPQSRNQLWTQVRNLNEIGAGDRVPHDALHGRGGSRRASHCDHRSRRDRRAGHLAGAAGPDRHTESLEDAFLALTGSSIRDETATSADQMRQVAAMWRRAR